MEEFYICAGARNIPLVEAVSNIQSTHKIIFNHFEERSAAFYALGRIKTLQKPIAVITTSGTAVGELFPAVMESYYSGLPLVLLTADRPSLYRGTGAPQSAEQKNIFGNYVSKCFDLEHGAELDLSEVEHDRPLHINVCFDVPLQSGHLLEINKEGVAKYNREKLSSLLENNTSLQLSAIKCEPSEQVNRFLQKHKKILVIVSQIKQDKKGGLINFLLKLNAPVYLEAISNIREEPRLSHLKILCADKIWAHCKKSNYEFSGVVKIGGTPTHRIWRDLDESKKDICVLSIAENTFSGMPGAQHITTNLDSFFSNTDFTHSIPTLSWAKFIELDRLSYKKLYSLFKKYPCAEQSYFFYLSQKIPAKSKVYLGTSLPIRYWDLAAQFEDKSSTYNASRGLNGIDGVISTFLGFAEDNRNNWGIFGDLTTLYDLSAPWMLQQRPNLSVNICIINNGGGKIFNKVLSGPLAVISQNNHQLHFEHWAKFWNIDYRKITNIDALDAINSNHNIIEIIPDPEQTEYFTQEYAHA